MTAAVLISGGGSNLQAFIDAVELGELDVNIGVVLSNRANAFGLERAKDAGIPVECLSHRGFADREAFDTALVQTLSAYAPDMIILAGFMRILTPVFINHFAGRILNIHPSLLPNYPGLNTHQRAIEAGDRWHGCTVHFVTAELDSGAAIMQGRVAVQAGETGEDLAERVLQVEHRIFPRAAALLASGRLEYRSGEAWLDGRMLEQPIQFQS